MVARVGLVDDDILGLDGDPAHAADRVARVHAAGSPGADRSALDPSHWPERLARYQANWMSSPMSRRIIFSVPGHGVVRGRAPWGRWSAGGRRPAAGGSGWPSAARPPNRRQVAMEAVLGSILVRASSVCPRITPRALLKSWATPPASRPTDSILRACVSWSLNLSRSSSARPAPADVLLDGDKMGDLPVGAEHRRDRLLFVVERPVLAAILQLAAPDPAGQDRVPEVLVEDLVVLAGTLQVP